MYGLLIENTIEFIKSKYGEDAWLVIREKSRIHEYNYVTHRMYSERIIPRLAQAVSEFSGCTTQEFMDASGLEFVKFLGRYGYDRMLRVLGRNMRDFLNGLDNLHEYLRFSYPKMKPPSFFCTDESSTGLTLHYRSRRPGYVHYVKGQLWQVGKQFYNLDVLVNVESEETRGNTTYVVFKLKFDNKEFTQREKKVNALDDVSVVNASLFFDLFPFHIMFNRKLKISNIGKSLAAVLPALVDTYMTDTFELKRPMLNLTWENIRAHENNVFELVSIATVVRSMSTNTGYIVQEEEEECGTVPELDGIPEHDDDEEYKDSRHSVYDKEVHEIIAEDVHPRRLRLKGQMKYVAEWNGYIFLATPFMPNLDAMFQTGLYINDLSMYDSSRDLVLAGTQQSAELKLALDQELQKSAQLEHSMRKLDQEIKRTDSLLYQMIPKAVADKLRRGEAATSTCEVFKEVTILFSDVVGFTEICSRIEPMQVVSMLNNMYTKFDQLSERHEVYKVETIGDAYMVVSGAPIATKYHSVRIAEMALAMKREISSLKDPSTGNSLQIRMGMHSGMVVAGVVGLKMPRYCLFGDTVNTASRMESTAEAMQIHISETAGKNLQEWPFYVLQQRSSKTLVKGKGQMKTFILIRKDQVDESEMPYNLREEGMNASRSTLNSSSESLRSSVGKAGGSHSSPEMGAASDIRSTLVSPVYNPVVLDHPVKSPTPMHLSPKATTGRHGHSSTAGEDKSTASSSKYETKLKPNVSLNVNNSRGSSEVIQTIPSFKIRDDTKTHVIGKVNNNLLEDTKNQTNSDATRIVSDVGEDQYGKSNTGKVHTGAAPATNNVPKSATCIII